MVQASKKQTPEEQEASLEELADLCAACDIAVAGKSLQNRISLDAATAVGRGKIEELAEMAELLEANLLIFNGELSGSQMANISEICGLKVIDRTILILDIFARRAKSSEGVLQVEIAQLQDRLTRLSGSGLALSRLGGGIGTRGPGETQLETDRRHIKQKIDYLKKRLKKLDRQRMRLRDKRSEREAVTIAVCGYTNAGKSSLINALCDTDLEAYDQLFATLDPRARRFPIAGPDILITDTVGFIRDLPHELVEAFKSTLDEVRYADFIIQVTDFSDSESEEQCLMVDKLLKELGASDKPRIHVLNKIDLCEPERIGRGYFRHRLDEDIEEYFISVKEGRGLDELQTGICEMVSKKWLKKNIVFTYTEQDKVEFLRKNAWISSISYEEDGIHVHFEAPPAVHGKLWSM